MCGLMREMNQTSQSFVDRLRVVKNSGDVGVQRHNLASRSSFDRLGPAPDSEAMSLAPGKLNRLAGTRVCLERPDGFVNLARDVNGQSKKLLSRPRLKLNLVGDHGRRRTRCSRS